MEPCLVCRCTIPIPWLAHSCPGWCGGCQLPEGSQSLAQGPAGRRVHLACLQHAAPFLLACNAHHPLALGDLSRFFSGAAHRPGIRGSCVGGQRCQVSDIQQLQGQGDHGRQCHGGCDLLLLPGHLDLTHHDPGWRLDHPGRPSAGGDPPSSLLQPIDEWQTPSFSLDIMSMLNQQSSDCLV